MKRPAPLDRRLKLEYRPLAKLKPYEKNARVHPPAQIDKIKRLIERIGFVVPILVDEHQGILKGHGSLQAAKQLDMRLVPVIELTGLTAAEKRAYIVADNKVALASGWDDALLKVELGELKDMGFDLGLTGFDPAELEAILAPPPSEPEEPGTPGRQKPAVSRTGDIWLLGDHRLACGDVKKPAALKALMDGASAQCVFTDPPYGVSYEGTSGAFEVLQGDELRRGQLSDLLHTAFENAVGHTRENAGWYVWHASATRDDFAKAMRDVGLVELGVIIWAKPGMAMGWSDYHWAHEPCFYAARQGVRPAFFGDRTETTVWRVSARTNKGKAASAIGSGIIITTQKGGEIYVAAKAPAGRKIRHIHADDTVLLVESTEADDLWEVARDKEGGLHPTMKPVELARRAIRNSTQEGDAVLDFFAGAASTIIACEQTGRVGYALDIDPGYVDVGVRRWQELTGKAATHATEKKTFAAIAKARTKGKATARAA
ncbi:MAG: site-specific DNA-methyltransferase [Gemmatimonadales bacterium]|nr:MAG: site-specific DNA-methyltransferase [Gemmatimonadales bacterium]